MKKAKISLIGFMGSGKSHLGRRLAQRMKLPFVDLDEEIENHYKTSIAEIFGMEGEEGFRIKESRLLSQILNNREPGVLSTGGGAPCFEQNIRQLTTHSTVIFLNPSIEALAYRLENSSTVRPVLQSTKGQELKDHITRLLAMRLPFYQRAHLSLAIDNRPHDLNADYVFQMYQKYKETLE